MKKNYFILSIALLFASFYAQAQVVNGNFENVKPNFLPSNWGMTFLQQFGFDEFGNPLGDQIQFTWCVPSMVYASFESESGDYAMEISNAFNVTQNTVIPGMASIFADPEQDSPGWNPGVPVNPGTSVIMLGFDYKFLPVGNDIAQATLEVVDADGNEIGKTSLDISGTHNIYEYVYSPIAVTHAGTPAFMYISFNMAKEGSEPTFGTRLLIDNVIVNFSSLITSENPEQGAKVYPTLVDNTINVVPNGFSDSVSYKIINTEGRVVKQFAVTQDSTYEYAMDLSDLNSGIYFLNIQDGTRNSTKKFIKK
ncbi:T9SS type A sorting domain-containing protein [Flavobacterium wongokense]|uniref:T9SS type A sorting domain-containing protein n=1 Tax=Flavobacterium wongokense TaxID=2910674 RepID=UPI001F3731DB|nr:T9SS type A sorting domain-containing protein [Flavobacterium sp. WG47]MCF6132332.1 T9SS type A sorting domain-containing protein [Flavobacterium sp. WG47]